MADERDGYITVTVTLKDPTPLDDRAQANRTLAFLQGRALSTFGCGCASCMRRYRDLVWGGQQSPGEMPHDLSRFDAWTNFDPS